MSFFERFLIVAVVLIWGINFVVIRWGIEAVDPCVMTALRFTFVALPGIFFVPRPSVSIRVLALYGILFGGGVWGLVNFAIFLGTPAGSASLLLQLSAFLSVIVAIIFFNESISLFKIIGIVLAFIGFIIIAFFRNEQLPFIGIIIVFVAAISWTICNVMIKMVKPNNVLSFVIWSSLFVPIPIVIISFFQAYSSNNDVHFLNLFIAIGEKGWISILFQSFITTLLGYGIWTWAIARHGLMNVVPFSLLVPVSGLFFGWLFYNETMTIPELTGAILILIGLILLSVKFQSKAQVKKHSREHV